MEGNSSQLIFSRICFFGFWEPELTQFMIDTIKPGQTVVDLGANHGYFTLLMSCLVDNGSVISIEASPDIYKRLDAHVALNHASNVKLHNIAVADHVGTVKLFNPLRYNEGSATIVPGPVDRGGTTVACDRFLSILGDDLRRTSFVKIDIEGAERSALEDILAGRDLFSRPLTIVSEVSPEESVTLSKLLPTQVFQCELFRTTMSCRIICARTSPIDMRCRYRKDGWPLTITSFNCSSETPRSGRHAILYHTGFV